MTARGGTKTSTIQSKFLILCINELLWIIRNTHSIWKGLTSLVRSENNSGHKHRHGTQNKYLQKTNPSYQPNQFIFCI